MDYTPLNSSVTAKKSWFFFDDSIVFLTNSINSVSGNRIETIIDQRPNAVAGIAPLNAQAGYAIVPKATAASMRTYVPPTIIANDSAASALRYGNTIGIVFWQAARRSSRAAAARFAEFPASVRTTPCFPVDEKTVQGLIGRLAARRVWPFGQIV